MDDHYTHPDIVEYIPLYLAYRGERKMDSLLGMSQAFRPVAEEQDSIGWRNFTEGKIGERKGLLQEMHLLGSDNIITIDFWTRGFIDQLLSLTHSQ